MEGHRQDLIREVFGCSLISALDMIIEPALHSHLTARGLCSVGIFGILTSVQGARSCALDHPASWCPRSALLEPISWHKKASGHGAVMSFSGCSGILALLQEQTHCRQPTTARALYSGKVLLPSACNPTSSNAGEWTGLPTTISNFSRHLVIYDDMLISKYFLSAE